MAERALLVSERADGRYAVARSRWGGTDRSVAAVCAGTPPDKLPGVTWETEGQVEDLTELGRRCEYLSTAAVYRVQDGKTTVFLPLWFGLPLESVRAAPTAGALVAVGSLTELRRVRRRFRRLKGYLADAVVAGYLPIGAAPLLLCAVVAHSVGRERVLSVFPDAAERLSANERPDAP